MLKLLLSLMSKEELSVWRQRIADKWRNSLDDYSKEEFAKLYDWIYAEFLKR